MDSAFGAGRRPASQSPNLPPKLGNQNGSNEPKNWLRSSNRSQFIRCSNDREPEKSSTRRSWTSPKSMSSRVAVASCSANSEPATVSPKNASPSGRHHQDAGHPLAPRSLAGSIPRRPGHKASLSASVRGGELRLTMILHTWGQRLGLSPHDHPMIAGSARRAGQLAPPAITVAPPTRRGQLRRCSVTSSGNIPRVAGS